VMRSRNLSELAAAPAAPAMLEDRLALDVNTAMAKGQGIAPGVAEPVPSAAPALEQVSARKNLNETAFFYPQLTTDSNGVVRMAFTMPEALTQWRFLGFAHDPLLRSGYIEATAVTSKDLMVQPNPPRFLREADTVEFTVKVSNQSEKPQ